MLDSSADDLTDIDESEKKLHDMLFGVSLFLTFSNCSIIYLRELWRFMTIFLQYLAIICNDTLLSRFSLAIPKSLHSIRKYLKANDQCNEYIVCPKCSTLYTLKDCIINQNGREVPKLCDYIEFPNHPHHTRRTKCNANLLKSVRVGK